MLCAVSPLLVDRSPEWFVMCTGVGGKMMDGRRSCFQGLSEYLTQRAVAPNAAERRGGRFKRSFLLNFVQ